MFKKHFGFAMGVCLFSKGPKDPELGTRVWHSSYVGYYF